jgi:hypothetical protein
MQEFGRVVRSGGVLILTDFHPAASARGWRRTFRRNGEVYEIENYPYTIDQLCEFASDFTLDAVLEASIGDAERELFERAGRPDLFSAACCIPAALLTRWIRR